jgi:hypothetical protein
MHLVGGFTLRAVGAGRKEPVFSDFFLYEGGLIGGDALFAESAVVLSTRSSSGAFDSAPKEGFAGLWGVR